MSEPYTLLVMTDGRDDCLVETLASFASRVAPPPAALLIHDDTGDAEHRTWVASRYPAARVIGSARGGFGSAIRAAWDHLRRGKHAWVFHLEDDFTFNRDIDIADMQSVLAADETLAQMLLMRQPWNAAERAAGSVFAAAPEAFTPANHPTVPHVLHRRYFSTNPSLYHRRLFDTRDWPEGAESEGRFGLNLFADPTVRCAVMGTLTDPPWVTHIGDRRAGGGY